MSGDELVKNSQSVHSFNVRSVHPGHKILENTQIINGRYLNNLDLDETRKVAVIGKLVKEKLFEDEGAVSKELNVGGTIYKVIGVFFDSGGEWEMKHPKHF